MDDWEESVRSRPGFENQRAAQNRMLLSAPTRLGLRITGKGMLFNAQINPVLLCKLYLVHSFLELLDYIFTSVPGVTVFLSNRLCQDPLENFFGCQRQRGRVNENPNVAEFIKNTQALRIVTTTCATVRGNCRGSKDHDNIKIDNTPLEKRRKIH